MTWVRASRTAHGVALRHALLGHALVVWIARRHHLGCSSASSSTREGEGVDACDRPRCMRAQNKFVRHSLAGMECKSFRRARISGAAIRRVERGATGAIGGGVEVRIIK